MAGIANLEHADILDRFDEVDATVRLPHRAVDLRMPGVADHDDLAALVAHLRDLDVDLRHQRARRVVHAESPRRCFRAHALRDPVRRKHDRRSLGNFFDFVDEHRALAFQVVDDEFVVHNLVAHVDRRAVLRQRALDDRDGPVDPGAEAAGIGEDDVQGQCSFAAATVSPRGAAGNCR